MAPDHPYTSRLLGLAACLATVTSVRGAELNVVSVEPAAHSLAASVNASILVHFDRPVDRSSFTGTHAFWAFGRWSGRASGVISFADADRTVVLTPAERFSAGETVMVILSHDIAAADGSPFRNGGHSFQFWTRSGTAGLDFVEIDRLSTRSVPSLTSQAYGGFASDLNGDRYLDITIVNEVTADLRVFLNMADGPGTFSDFIEPTFAVGRRASPSEPSDFNGDGFVDVCVANIDDDTVSVLLGAGDGTFGPQQLIAVGNAPRGIAVLDVDGDGDMDIAVTSQASSNVSLILNDGSGVFGSAIPFDPGGAREWALAAADMNNDGMLDLVIGDQGGQEILISRANGDGTFTTVGAQASGGAVWMLVCGDVNGDGAEDVASVNSSTDNGAILLGDGTGQLLPPALFSLDDFPLATDLGDLDGDGDLDWVTSSFNFFAPGKWFVFLNDGGGSFSFLRSVQASEAASCALLLDLDNDLDLDMAMVDEVADEVILLKNKGTPAVPAASTWGMVATFSVMLVAGIVLIARRSRFHHVTR